MKGLNNWIVKYNEWKESLWTNKIIVLTWPRGAGKSFSILKLSWIFSELEIVRQITCRWERNDDNGKLIVNTDEETFRKLKSSMFVSTWKYWILLDDIKKALNKWKIPILTLWWKEIIKLQSNGLWDNLFVINITYPLNEFWELNSEILNEILEWRFSDRNWSIQEKEENINRLLKYMKLFFNNPRFNNRFSLNIETWINDNTTIPRIIEVVRTNILALI